MKQILLLILATLLATTDALAFEYTYEGTTLNYRVLDEEAKTCEVYNSSTASGDVVIPSVASKGTNEYTVVGVGSNAFYPITGDNGLTSIEIPNTVTYIDGSAFERCVALKSVTIGTGIEKIENGAFSYCNDLTSVTLLSTEAPSIGSSAFDSYNYFVTTLNIPEGALELYLKTGWSRFCKIVSGNEQRNLAITDGIFHYKILNDHEASLIVGGYGNLTEAFIPERFVDETDPDNPVRYTIVEIEKEAFKGCKNLKSLRFNSNSKVATIGNSAFLGCTGLTSVSIGNSVKTIYDNAFNGCTALTDLTLGNSVGYIGRSAFNNCSNLGSVSIPASVYQIMDGAFKYCPKLKKIDFESIEALCSTNFLPDWYGYWNEGNSYTYNRDLYVGGELVTDLVVPETVESIARYSFYGCKGLKSISIPKSVRYINEGAFGESGLESITISGSYLTIYDYVFKNCISLSSIRILNESCPSVSDRAFNTSSNYTSIYKSATLYIPERAISYVNHSVWGQFENIVSGEKPVSLYSDETLKYWLEEDSENPEAVVIGVKDSSLTDVNIPDHVEFNDGENVRSYSVVEIGYQAFYNKGDLTSVTIPSSVTTIGESAFLGTGLSALTIPTSVTTIGKSAFRLCKALTAVNLPNSITNIGWSAFDSCFGLEEITIPGSVSVIGSGAFSICNNLKSVTIHGSNKKIEASAFQGDLSLKKVEFDSLEALCSMEFMDNTSNPLIFAKHLYIDGAELIEVKIPESITQIGDYTFIGGAYLTSVELHKSVASIGIRAFQSCSSLTSVTLPNSMTSIGYMAFDGCSSLSSLTLPNSVATISSSAFSGCALEEVVLPPSVEAVEDYAFSGNANLKTVIMGHNVSSIGENAFKNCPVDNVYCTALNPPTAPNTAFTRYSGKLSVANEQTIDTYYDALSCWDRFDTYAAMVEPTALLVDGDPYLTGNVGDTFRLSASIEPADVTLPHIFWRSTNPAIAKVDHNGVVEIVSDEPGECRIIAESLYADAPMASLSVNPDLSAIEAIGADSSAAAQIDFSQPFEVFNLQGMRLGDSLTNLAPGLYIIRQGAAAAKHLIR